MKRYEFKNSKQMVNGLGIYLKKALDDVAEICMNQLKQNIEDNMYSWTPKKYKRTNQILKSISKTKTIKVNNLYVAKVYFDAEKIKPVIREGNTWNAHADFWGNEISGSDILNWLDRGTENKYYSHEGYEFMEEIFVWLDQELNNLFREHISKYGLQLK